jgi:hypothetical protein
MDLPCDDGSASFETYADVVCAVLGQCDDDVVLVGHQWPVPLLRWSRLVDLLIIWCICAPRSHTSAGACAINGVTSPTC